MEGIPDDFLGVKTIHHQIGALGFHIGKHIEDQRQTLAAACLRQEGAHQRFGGGAGIVGHIIRLSYAEFHITAAERLKV